MQSKPTTTLTQPTSQGLYQPDFEHDACGIGFIAHIKGQKSHQIIQDSLKMLSNLEHRGACGCEENTGDGAGILTQIPHEFLKKELKTQNIELPSQGSYGVGMVFLPQSDQQRTFCETTIEQITQEEKQKVLCWRDVPLCNNSLGESALKTQPYIRQFIIEKKSSDMSLIEFERKLFVIRKKVEKLINSYQIKQKDLFYIVSLSCKTIVYKGMLKSTQVNEFYPDLAHPNFESAIALVHSRFSTNTFPNWERAHPYRCIVHNGEINTLRGNVNWMHAREALFASELFGKDIQSVLPVLDKDGSDSGIFDNCLEFLVLSGRPLEEALLMMIPQPWSKHPTMDPQLRAFYEYYNSLMEPWDGPASVAFTDGIKVGAVLDRNGLRPSRYLVTKDGRMIMASESGALAIPANQVLKKGRIEPGKILLVDTEAGKIIEDNEVKAKVATENPYQEWIKDHLIDVKDLSRWQKTPRLSHKARTVYHKVFGYTQEDFQVFLGPMAKNGFEPVGAMGNDTPLAVFSHKPQPLFNYFKQIFAQVTNPPVDPIREEIVMASDVRIGPERNLLESDALNCHQIQHSSPILTHKELAKIQNIKRKTGFKSVTIPILFQADKGGVGLEAALEKLFSRAKRAITKGASILILSDRNPSEKMAPIPSLLAISALHHYLIRNKLRTHVGIIVESGEPREIHHFAALCSYGASAIHPYLALESIEGLYDQGLLAEYDREQAERNYIQAVNKGIIKIISKMGISTIRSYCGAQIFEALGLNEKLINEHFTWTPSRIGGVGLTEVAQEVLERHQLAFPNVDSSDDDLLDPGGTMFWRKKGEFHLFNPTTIHKLQHACQTNQYSVYKEFANLINEQEKHPCTIRSFFQFKKNLKPIPIEEVEPIDSILKRFKTGAISYGSISQEAHETLAIAMNRIGGKSNTGEGGEHPSRHTPDANGDSRNSAIKQVASGRFGVTSEYLVNAKEIQIKISQGAKPGEGGQLPGNKAYPWIAEVRHSTPGVGLISPPPHHDIYSIEDLAQLIFDLKNANPQAKINVKLVAAAGIGTIAAGVAKAKADVILVSGYDGGTGASPVTSIKHAGVPWELGIAETHQTLLLNNLRSRVRLEVDGQMKTGKDVISAALLGAEEFGFGTGPLIALGCIMMRVCNKNTCPVGVATQDPRLRKKFGGKPEHVVNYMKFIAHEVREIMAQLGVKNLNELIGNTDLLEVKNAPSDLPQSYKLKNLDFSKILYKPNVPKEFGTYQLIEQDHKMDETFDVTTLIPCCKPALESQSKVTERFNITNIHRATGTILGSEITKKFGSAGLKEDTIHLHFNGSAGQSFGAFVPPGLTLTLEGDSNDYLGKGLSGGKIISFPDQTSDFNAEKNVITGNVAFYGATQGEAYIRGLAGERFCVRNSGITAVIEGIGDHGCEYMTGGKVVILGPTGKNFAAGMSGGIAYLYTKENDIQSHCNRSMVYLESVSSENESTELLSIIKKHFEYTKSSVAQKIIHNWKDEKNKFIKVIPKDYKRMISTIEEKMRLGLTVDQARISAFKQNSQDQSRVSGN